MGAYVAARPIMPLVTSWPDSLIANTNTLTEAVGCHGIECVRVCCEVSDSTSGLYLGGRWPFHA
eukprot:7107580-Alexandrium_andersonii.AAC.1